MRTTAMQIEFADLVRHDGVHTDEFAIVCAMLGVVLAFWIWPMYLTRDEIQRL